MVATNAYFSKRMLAEQTPNPNMDHSVFMALLARLRKAPLTADKFYLLQTATRSLFFSPAQCLDIVRCFAHSEDKAAIMDLIEKRLCTKVDLKWATLIVKSAAFSKDRLKMLKVLLKHLQELSEEDAKSFVTACFDSERDREAAWNILSERFEYSSSANQMTTYSGHEFDNTAPFMIFQCIESMAKSSARPMSAFDLPLLDELSLLRKTIIENRQAISDEVAKRHREGHHFHVPSRVSAITSNLKPGRVTTVADHTPKIIRTCATDAVHAHGWNRNPATPSPTENGSYYSAGSRKSDYNPRRVTHSPNSIWNIVNPAHSSPLSSYYMGNSVGVVR